MDGLLQNSKDALWMVQSGSCAGGRVQVQSTPTTCRSPGHSMPGEVGSHAESGCRSLWGGLCLKVHHLLHQLLPSLLLEVFCAHRDLKTPGKSWASQSYLLWRCVPGCLQWVFHPVTDPWSERGEDEETRWSMVGLDGDRDGHLRHGHHCLVTAGEGTHELCLPAAPSELQV